MKQKDEFYRPASIDFDVANSDIVPDDQTFIYKIGEVAEVETFDKDRWSECSTGIHFFISREMAVIH